MKVMVTGSDGYLGSQYVQTTEHETIALDNYYKRHLLAELDIEPLYPVPMLHEHHSNACYHDVKGEAFRAAIIHHKPDVIIHLAENPSAPYSMRDHGSAREVISNNLFTTLNIIYAIRDINPDIHLIKLGTMGQYGCPNVKIPEGWFDCEIDGRTDRLLFPRTPHSIYHLSKTFDSDALAFACRMWDLRVTDLQQGFVWGLMPDTKARFCYDAEFGTVLNRFMIQALAGHFLTIYGQGGQTRGVLHISDTIKCLDLAIENKPDAGEYRVINQLTEWKSINDLAYIAGRAAEQIGLDPTLDHIQNPRVEKENHFYEVEHQTLKDYGLEPSLMTTDMVADEMLYLSQFKENINTDLIQPKVKWKC